MKTLIAISDTHGCIQGVLNLKARLLENSYTVHLGDGFSDIRELYHEYPKKIYAVRGNCDGGIPLPTEEVLEIEGSRVLCCHGHEYGVKSGLSRLAYRAQELNCNVVLYGHTHRASIEELGGVTLVNPGTMKYPLESGGSYAYLVFNGKKVVPVIVGNPMTSPAY